MSLLNPMPEEATQWPGQPGISQDAAIKAQTDALLTWIAQQRAVASARGLWNDETGLPTQKGLLNGVSQYGDALVAGTSAPGGGVARQGLYYRSTNGAVENPGVGYSMWANDADKVAHYGKNHYEMDLAKIPKKSIVDAEDEVFRKKVVDSLDDAEHLLDRYQTNAEHLAYLNPKDIVDHAGLWDSPDLVSHVWEHVMEPNGWTVVKTPNGAISFDPAYAKLMK